MSIKTLNKLLNVNSRAAGVVKGFANEFVLVSTNGQLKKMINTSGIQLQINDRVVIERDLILYRSTPLSSLPTYLV